MGPKLAESLPRAVMAPARLAACECVYECVCVCVLGRGERASSRVFVCLFFPEALGRRDGASRGSWLLGWDSEVARER